MRFLNMCANKFFSIAFSWALGQSVKDTLCGTKALSRHNYLRISANRSFFGDFDPFGQDFRGTFRPEQFAELTTPAALFRKGSVFLIARPPSFLALLSKMDPTNGKGSGFSFGF